jgi:uncharacterized 2Fe-2S/4Fe-4S cluster protein (DUF4445 family)
MNINDGAVNLRKTPGFQNKPTSDRIALVPQGERVQIVGGQVHLKTIGDQPPVGICGSGIVDAISEMHRAGIIDRRGVLRAGVPGMSPNRAATCYTLAAAETTGHGRDITVTRKDIYEVQLAKAAIRAGLEMLMREAGATYDEIDAFIIAGAFGAYLDVTSCARIRMFPTLPVERYEQVGNAAGAGARQLLLSRRRCEAAVSLSRRVTYVELMVHPEFTKCFLSELRLA